MSRRFMFLTISSLIFGLLATFAISEPTSASLAATATPTLSTKSTPIIPMAGEWLGDGNVVTGLIHSVVVNFSITEDNQRVTNIRIFYVLDDHSRFTTGLSLVSDIVDNSFYVKEDIPIQNSIDTLQVELRGTFISPTEVEGTFDYQSSSFKWTAHAFEILAATSTSSLSGLYIEGNNSVRFSEIYYDEVPPDIGLYFPNKMLKAVDFIVIKTTGNTKIRIKFSDIKSIDFSSNPAGVTGYGWGVVTLRKGNKIEGVFTGEGDGRPEIHLLPDGNDITLKLTYRMASTRIEFD